MELPSKSPQFWVSRIRGLFDGLGYALSLTFIFVASWALEGHVGELPYLSVLEALQRIAATGMNYALATLPAIPLLILAVNTAPRRAIKLVAWLTVPIMVMAWWRTQYLRSGIHDPSWLASFSEGLLTATLLAAVCLYHRSLRGATGALLRSQIQGATLGAALDRARLALLRSQIEPHFLFNTLANVRTLAHSDRCAAVEMLDNLMRYLDAALPKLHRDECPLGEEMQMIDAYLGIYRMRMGVRLSYEVSFPPELASIRVPTMMLLTLVENALKHGINPTLEGGFIRVSAARSGRSLLLKVADSGQGITVTNAHGTGTGLSNIRLRLMTQFGEAAALTLAHAEPRGVVAAISLPIVTG